MSEPDTYVIRRSLTGVEKSPANNVESATNGTKNVYSTWYVKNTKGKLELHENDRGAFPSDGSKVDTVVSFLEDFICIDFAK